MREELKYKLISRFAYLLCLLTAGTLRLEVRNEEKLLKIKEEGKSIIFSFWHGQLWLPAYHFKNKGYIALTSQSRDGEYISRTLEKLGWEMVRGSTSKGGARSLLKLIKKARAGKDIAITPDGPRGPRHKAQPGITFLAQKSNSVIIPGGVAFSREKVFDSWDRFQLAKPFSKAVLFYGEPIEVKDEINSDEVALYTELIEDKMNQSNLMAKRILGEIV